MLTHTEIALIAVGSVLTYTIGCGVMYALAKHREWDTDEPEGIFGVILWPLFLPALFASMATTRLLRGRTTLPKATARER